MDEVMTRYFGAEKSESLLFIAVGIIAIAISVWLLMTKSAYRAAAWPLIAVAFIQIVVGSTVYFRTDRQVAELRVALEHGETSAEIARMTKVMRSFVLYRWIEIALALAGIAMIFAGRHSIAWRSAGIALAAQALLMLLLDLFAEQRGELYLDELERL
jgi:hypothetical protein